ncbi:MAG: hypothetical protein AAF726_01215 [Planctomycetota bacterium]
METNGGLEGVTEHYVAAAIVAGDRRGRVLAAALALTALSFVLFWSDFDPWRSHSRAVADDVRAAAQTLVEARAERTGLPRLESAERAIDEVDARVLAEAPRGRGGATSVVAPGEVAVATGLALLILLLWLWRLGAREHEAVHHAFKIAGRRGLLVAAYNELAMRQVLASPTHHDDRPRRAAMVGRLALLAAPAAWLALLACFEIASKWRAEEIGVDALALGATLRLVLVSAAACMTLVILRDQVLLDREWESARAAIPPDHDQR